jgi:hypothetical protein
MAIRTHKTNRATTLVGLMIAMIAGAILLLATLLILFHGHLGFHRLYGRINSEVIRDCYQSRRLFDAVLRKSSIRRCDILSGNNEAYVYYFSNPQDTTIADPDRYARFYLQNDDKELWIEQGDVAAGTFDTPEPVLPTLTNGSARRLCHEIIAPESGIFTLRGTSVRMMFTVDNETDPAPGVSKIETLIMTLTATAIRHNM